MKIIPQMGLLWAMVVSLGSGCATPRGHHDAWWGEDKLKHFVVAGGISAAATAIASQNGASDGAAFAVAVPITLGAGSAKEWHDREVKGTYWSWRDMAWNAVGAAAGSIVVLEAQ